MLLKNTQALSDASELCDEKEKPCLSSSIPPMGGHALAG
jgi:hypothetical protein